MNDHTGETVVLFRLHKRRREIAELLQALVDKHPTGTIYVAWDNASMQEEEEIEGVVWAAAGRLVVWSVPTYSPWLNPSELVWRYFRREVTHGELFPDEAGPACSSSSVLRALQPVSGEDPLRHRLESRKSCLIVLSRWLVRSGRKVLFNRIEVGRLLLRQPFHHLLLYPYLTNQR